MVTTTQSVHPLHAGRGPALLWVGLTLGSLLFPLVVIGGALPAMAHAADDPASVGARLMALVALTVAGSLLMRGMRRALNLRTPGALAAHAPGTVPGVLDVLVAGLKGAAVAMAAVWALHSVDLTSPVQAAFLAIFLIPTGWLSVARGTRAAGAAVLDRLPGWTSQAGVALLRDFAPGVALLAVAAQLPEASRAHGRAFLLLALVLLLLWVALRVILRTLSPQSGGPTLTQDATTAFLSHFRAAPTLTDRHQAHAKVRASRAALALAAVLMIAIAAAR